MAHLITIFIAAILTHNIALTYLLGMCPFVSLSRSVKTAMGMIGKISPELRLPLCPMLPENEKRLEKALKEYKLI